MIKGTWTEYLRKTISDLLVGRAEYYAPTAFYVALWCNASVTNPNGEVASDSYLRFRIDNDYDNFFEYAEGAKRNRTAITFPTANEDWGIVTHVVIFDGMEKDVTETFDSADVTDNVIALSWATPWPVGTAVRFTGTNLPTGIGSGTTYYISSPVSSGTRLSLSAGGDEIAITATGNGGDVVMRTFSEPNILWYGEIATPKEVRSGDIFSFPPSALKIEFPALDEALC